MLTRFARNDRGAVAILFAFALVPLLAVVGITLEYSRSTRTLADLQSAVDGAALAAGRSALDSDRKDLAQIARATFDTAFRPESGIKVTSFKVTQTPASIGVKAHAAVPTIFGGIIGKSMLDIEARAEVPLGIMALEVALVLDNTGSMNKLGKMDALKQAAKSLIDAVQSAPGGSNSSFALVPFNTQVNVGDGNRYASWLRFSPGSPEPKLDVNQATWTGCVADRDQNEDVRDTLPNVAKPDTLYPAANCQYANLKAIMPLSRDFRGMKTAIDLMVPTGNTNTGIGLAWGLAALTPGAPLSGIARPPGPRIQKTIVFLTDGLNTENRWTKDAAQIDKRTAKICDQIKSNKIRLYTIRVIEGNETLLRDCATQPSMYFSVNQASELNAVFDRIAADLTTLRLAF
jgi:Flp pilus assembly protein TadG